MFFFTTCTSQIEKVQIWSRTNFASLTRKSAKNTKKMCFCLRFFSLFFLLFVLMSGCRELSGHALYEKKFFSRCNKLLLFPDPPIIVVRELNVFVSLFSRRMYHDCDEKNVVQTARQDTIVWNMQ
jgi:hypothetical protein